VKADFDQMYVKKGSVWRNGLDLHGLRWNSVTGSCETEKVDSRFIRGE
jgi:hypothetical protein